jgi:hypothetical protein
MLRLLDTYVPMNTTIRTITNVVVVVIVVVI